MITKFAQLIESLSDFSSTSEIYTCIAKFVPQILPADHMTITHYSNADEQIVVHTLCGEHIPGIEVSEGQKFNSYATYQEYAESVANPTIYSPADSLGREINVMLHNAGIQSVLVVPLTLGLEIIGTINIAAKDHTYNKSDQFRLEQISALLATSINHNQVFSSNDEIARHHLYARHLEHLNQLSEELFRATSVGVVLDLVASCATKLVSAERISLCELDPDDSNFIKIVGLVGQSSDRRGMRVRLDESGLADTLIQGEKKYATNLRTSTIRAQRSLGESGYNHIWSFPIFHHGKTASCLNILSQRRELHIEDAMSVLDTLARLLHSKLERLYAQQELVIQAKTDPLTGLCNRAEFNLRLQNAISKDASHGNVCIMYLDLDFFKNVNDTMGHLVGDEVLVGMANRLSQILLPQDVLARIGGDEFMILMTHLKSRSAVEIIAQDLIDIICEPHKLPTQNITIGGSIGICEYPQHGSSAEELIKNADIAMYKAKDLGRNQFYTFTKELAEELSYKLQLQKDLSIAIAEDQFSLVFQPQYDTNSKNVYCVEVLLRWNHSELGMIPPDVFIPIAENCGLIASVTDWVLKNALSAHRSLLESHPHMRMAINVSAVEFSPQLNLRARLLNAANYSGIDPQAIEIELTETAFLKDPDHAVKLANELNDSGFSIALDDFGTGYASLTYLAQLPIKCLKIDKSFVDGIELDEKKQAIVRGIVAISNGLNINCLAEGVETTEQLSWLSSAGCTSAQGYLFSKPVSFDQLEHSIEQLNHSVVKAA